MNPTPGAHVKAPVEVLKADPIGRAASSSATRRGRRAAIARMLAERQLDSLELFSPDYDAARAPDAGRLPVALVIPPATPEHRRIVERRRRNRRRALACIPPLTAPARRPAFDCRHRSNPVRHREEPAPDPFDVPQVVPHDPDDRVHAVGQRRRIENPEPDRATAIRQAGGTRPRCPTGSGYSRPFPPGRHPPAPRSSSHRSG